MKKTLLHLIGLVIVVILNVGCEEKGGSEESDCVSVTPLFTYTIVDTNQTLCYDSTTGDSVTCTGTGQDGEYSNEYQPEYVLCNDESVAVDQNTGLMWQTSTDTDGVSGLTDDDKMARDEAESYCSSLTYGTYTDWRLPSVKELYSIYLFSGRDLSGMTNATTNGASVDYSGISPYIDNATFDIGYGDTNAGERIIDGQYATTTVNVSNVTSGITESSAEAFFGVNFVDGHVKSYETDITVNGVNTATYYVRCVRDNTSYGTNSFVNNNDTTISDTATGLMWEQDDSNATDFDDALSICNDATTAGHSDWRLPNIKELQSIVDYTKSPAQDNSPAIDTDYFNATSFINEAGQTDWGYYWSSSALLDYTGDGSKGAYITFGRGLGYINEITDVHGAGAQRSDYKTVSAQVADASTLSASSNCTFGTTTYKKGPQGDILRAGYNFVRCVRDID